MTWQDRRYNDGPDTSAYGAAGGLRSWFGGVPAPGKAVKWLAVANIAIFLLCQFTGGFRSPVYQWLAMRTDSVLHGQIWRLFTFTYLHDQTGLWHILMNLLGLYFLGMPLERHWGTRRFFVFYTLGGFIAVLLYCVVTLAGWLPSYGTLVGASGGVLAVLGACAVLFPGFRIILLVFPVPIRTAVLLLLVLYTFNLWSQGENAGGDACHLAGLAFGVAWGYRGEQWIGAWHGWRSKVQRGARETKLRRRHEMEVEVDRILEKVHIQGLSSLTRREKRTLEEASRRQREEEVRGKV